MNLIAMQHATESFLKHLRLHQDSTLCRKCPTCKLNFTNKSEYYTHRKVEHKAFTFNVTQEANETMSVLQQRTIMHRGIKNAASISPKKLLEAPSKEQQKNKNVDLKQHSMNAPSLSHVTDFSTCKIAEDDPKLLLCLECKTSSLASTNHRQYLPCSECVFASFCPVSFVRHQRVIHQIGHFNIDERYTAFRNCNAAFDKQVESADNTICDVKQYFCEICGSCGMSGNELASHLIEVCNGNSAVLVPTEDLQSKIKAQKDPNPEVQQPPMKLFEDDNIQQLLVSTPVTSSQAEIVGDSQPLFEYSNVAPAYSYADTPQSAIINDDENSVVMETTNQQALMDYVNDQQQSSQTMIEFPGPDGQMQTMMLPEDFQLEQGQSLVMVQGDDGQPQLMVVNQSDIMNEENPNEPNMYM